MFKLLNLALPPWGQEGLLVFSEKLLTLYFAIHFFSLPVARHAGDPPGHHGASKCGSRRCSVARALGLQRREKKKKLAGNHGIASHQLGPIRPMLTPKTSLPPPFAPFPPLSLVLFWKYQRLGSHGTTAELQAFPFVTVANGASVCGFVSVRVCACVRARVSL